jgi:hypothetical protein
VDPGRLLVKVAKMLITLSHIMPHIGGGDWLILASVDSNKMLKTVNMSLYVFCTLSKVCFDQGLLQ